MGWRSVVDRDQYQQRGQEKGENRPETWFDG
jgi:hypothetical protein